MFGFDTQRHGHLALWAVIAIVGFFVFITYFSALITALFVQILLCVIVGAVLFLGDLKLELNLLAAPAKQFIVACAAAVAIFVIAAYTGTGPISNIVLRVCDVVILMCVFSLCTVIWHNRESVQQSLNDIRDRKADPLATLRSAANASAGAVKQGFDNARSEAGKHMPGRSGT